MKYQVIVSNAGAVVDTDELVEAERIYKLYMQDADDHYGRVGGENVTLLCDGEIVRQFIGEQE